VNGGDWDIDTTANWKLTPGNTPSTYLQSAVPGEPVISTTPPPEPKR
jgi:hypothetical protein